MHFDRKELRQYVNQSLTDDKMIAEISSHVNECEFCREYCEEYRIVLDSEKSAQAIQIPSRAFKVMDLLYKESLSGKIISLKRLEHNSARIFQLAADSGEKRKPEIENIANMYSDQPELILRLMRDNLKKQDYIQLIADDDSLISGVMVEIPDADQSFITDNNGIALMDDDISGELSSMKWQIKMPSATFELNPLKYDPEATEYQQDIILQTEKNDKIKVSFQGKTAGKQISISILQLEGQKDFGHVRMIITQKDKSQSKILSPNGEMLFTITNPKDEIKIRLF